MTQQHGRRYEHQLVNGLDDVTPAEVWLTSAGYSGNSAADDCDIVVTVDPKFATRHDTWQFNIEAKRRQGEKGKRISNAISGSSKDETGIEELERLIEGTPSWAEPIVALKMDHRKLVVVDARDILRYVGRLKQPVSTEALEVLNVLDPRLTPSDNISVVKPETDEWDSAQVASADEVVLAEQLGLPYEGGNS